MIASSKGYLLPDFLLSVCVHIIAEISDTRHMDSLWSQTDSRHSKDLSDSIPVRPTSVAAQTSASEDMNEVRPCRSTTYDIRHQSVSSARTLVLSIMLRTAFGGMAGDMKMLREYAAQWYGRFFLQANNLSSNPCNFSCPTSICLSTSISTLSRPLISRGATGFSYSYSESSVAMSSYLHPQWMESTMGFLWGWQCIMAYAISDPDDRTIPAINANVVSSAFLLLRNCISANLLHNSKLSLALYSPAAPQGSLSIAGKNAYQALRLTPKDLVSEGIDFHCDGEIVKAVFDRCAYISAVISSRPLIIDIDRYSHPHHF